MHFKIFALILDFNFNPFKMIIKFNKTRMVRFIPHGTVNNNLGPDRLAGPKSSLSQSLQTTNHLIARPMSGSLKCA